MMDIGCCASAAANSTPASVSRLTKYSSETIMVV